MILDNNYFSGDEINIIKNKRISILGLGGLGSHSSSQFARLGIEKINIVDFDTYDLTNLNRQLFSNTDTIGKKKVSVVSSELKKINSDIEIKEFDIKIDSNNILTIIKNSDIVIDGLDNIETRTLAIKACSELNIPFVFASVSRVYGYVSVITDYSKNNIINIIEKISGYFDIDKHTTSFTVSVVSGIQVAESIKYLLGKKSSTQNKLITIDLENTNIKHINI